MQGDPVRYMVRTFDLRQFKKDTRDWETAFEKAIRKRTAGLLYPAFMGLSGGCDPGNPRIWSGAGGGRVVGEKHHSGARQRRIHVVRFYGERRAY